MSTSPSALTDPALRAQILELNVAKYAKQARPTEKDREWFPLYKQIKATMPDALPDSSLAKEWCDFVFRHLTDAEMWNRKTFPNDRAWWTFQYLLRWQTLEGKTQAGPQRGGQAGTSAHTRGMAVGKLLTQPVLDMMVSFTCTEPRSITLS